MRPTVPAPYQLFYKEVTESTNDDAAALARDGAPDFTLVWAKSQTKGRGRFNRRWLSEPGNLYWSVILRVEHPWPPLESLSYAVALAIGCTIRSLVPPTTPVEYKWPNDVLCNNKKISGTLSEGSGYDTGWIVVGIGINVLKSPDIKGGLYSATCLNDETGEPLSVELVCNRLCDYFYTIVNHWRANGFDTHLREDYMRHFWRLDRRITVSFDAEKSGGYSGINRGLHSDGALLLELDSGEIKKIYAGDVGGAP